MDRNFGNAQGLWTCNPDGTNHAGYYGNNTPAGGVVLNPQAIPGTDLILCILGSCHDRPWGALTVVGAGPPEIKQAYSWGSHASKLTRFREGTHKHPDVKLTPVEMERITTWVDLNAPYYPSYASAYPHNPYGRSPLSVAQIGKLKQLGVDTGIIDISFDRPELSPGLAKLPKTDPRYVEALAIIREGQQSLKKNSNPDAEGFVPCEADQQRDRKYEMRAQIERQNRAAIRDGKKIYDPPPAAP